MVLTASKMLPLGSKAPDFSLINTLTDEVLSLQQIKSEKGTVVMFICNHCPYVLYILNKLVDLVKSYQAQGIAFVAISSNDVHIYPADAPNKMRELALSEGFTFPYLYDETQQVAKSYQAACTPDFFVFNGDLECVYRGQFDDSSPKKDVPITGNSLTTALDCLLQNKPVDEDQRPSMGCNIKWKNV